MRGHSTAVSELHSSLALPNFGLVRAVIICATSRKSAESSTHRAASPQMYPHPWSFRQLGTWSVHVARRCRLRTSARRWQLRCVWTSEGFPVLRSMSVDCGGLASAWINEAGVFALTMASKLPSAKKSQCWVFSGSAEQMTDMLPRSALFIHLSPSDSLSVLKHSISSAGTSPAATCDSHASSCCLNVQVDAALSAGRLRQSLQKAFQQKQWQWAYLLRMAMTFMPATLGRSDDLRKLPWSCLATEDAGWCGANALCGNPLW